LNKLFVYLILTLSTISSAQASIFNGDIIAPNQIITFNFSVVSDGLVNAWTTSGFNRYQDLTDPTLAIWKQTSDLTDWILEGANDDANGSYGSTNFFDAGVTLSLTTGNYLATVTNSMNTPSGPLLSAGFNGNGLNQPTNIGAFNLQISGNDSSVPVPAVVWLFGSGLIGLTGLARKRKSA
jgi:hypothetical protein